MEKDAVLARLKIGEPLLWTTGGSLLPPAEFSSLVARGSRAAPAFPDSIACRR